MSDYPPPPPEGGGSTPPPGPPSGPPPGPPPGPPGGGYTPPPPPPGGGYSMPPGGGYTPPPAPPGGGDYPPQYPYPAGGYGGAPQSNQKALWSMILGIASLVTCFCCAVFPLGLGGAAIFLGRSAKAEIEASGGMQTGAGQAQAGFVLGIVGVALGAVALVLTIILFASGDGSFTTYNDF